MFLNPKTMPGRIAVTFGALLLMVGACEMPTSSQVAVGKKILVRYDSVEAGSGLHPAHDSQVLMELLHGVGNTDDLSVSISESPTGPSRVDILAWGEHIVTDEVLHVVHERLGELPGMSVEVSDLSGTVREKLRDRIGRTLFNIEVRGETAEEIRAEILAQLAAQGFDGNAAVDVQIQDGQKTITVEMDKDSAAAGESSEDSMIIELKDGSN